MKCPKCSYENERDANFCIRCGSRLAKQRKKKLFLIISLSLFLLLIIIASVIISYKLLPDSVTSSNNNTTEPDKSQQSSIETSSPAPEPAPALPTPAVPTVVVPDSVKDKWSGVKFIIEDKETEKSHEYSVNLHSEFQIPGSNLKIAVGEFLPDFRMDVGTITSASNEPNNPAVHIIIYDGNKEVYKGWLYAKFPAIHPFEHPNYSVILKEGIPN